MTGKTKLIKDEETLNYYLDQLMSEGYTPVIAQGKSMQPVIEPNDLVAFAPLDSKYLKIGSIYAFSEGDRLIIKRLVDVVDTVKDGSRGNNYIFEGDNRDVSLDKKVFVSNLDTVKSVFKRVVSMPFSERITIDNTLVNKIQGGSCMSEENLRNPQLKPETIEQIRNNQDLMQFVQDVKAVAHNASLRVYEMSCIQDGILNFLRDKDMTTTDEMWNYIHISTKIKEWHGETQQYLSFNEFFEKFFPNLTKEDLKSGRHKLNLKPHIEEFNKTNMN
jgi:hypothetical protein